MPHYLKAQKGGKSAIKTKIIRLLTTIILAMLLLFTASCGNSHDNTDDTVKKIAGISKDTILLTIDDRSITAEEYFYWMSQILDTFYSYNASGSSDSALSAINNNWDTIHKSAIENIITAYYQAMIHANEYGVSISTDEINKKVDQSIDDSISFYASKNDFIKTLSKLCISETGYRKICEESIIASDFCDKVFGEGGALCPSDNDVIEYAESEGYYNCRYFFLSTTGQYSEESVEEVHQRAQKAYEIITSYTSQEDRDSAMLSFINNTAWNEDTEIDSEGNLLSLERLSNGGWLDSEFDEGVWALEIGDISIIEDSAYGYFVVERLPLSPAPLRDSCVQKLFTQQVSDWNQISVITYTESYYDCDFAKIYKNLLAYRKSLE